MAKRGWILAVILAGLMVAAVGGGVILAHGGIKGSGGFDKTAADGKSLAARVAEILALEESQVTDAIQQAKDNWDGERTFVAETSEILDVEESALKDALAQAKHAMANEAVRTRMDAMVEKELITQEEADQFVEWFEARPAFLERDGWMKRSSIGKGMSKTGWRDGFHRGKRGGRSWGKHWNQPEPANEEHSSTGYTES